MNRCSEKPLADFAVFILHLSYHVITQLSYLPLRATEEVFAALEDNQVKLSTMKASRFVKAFEQDVDKWERVLSHILEVVEMLLQVQRQWMYLEVRTTQCVVVLYSTMSDDLSKYNV